jgi:2-polyprenyl-3-methyl-5-hydroxy-6-metoxy-1,4-benzoquinol methylase
MSNPLKCDNIFLEFKPDKMDRSAYLKFHQLEVKHFWRIAKRKLILQIVKNIFRDRTDLKILDIGGSASLLPSQMSRFGKVIVIEPDSQTIEFVRKNSNIDIRQGKIPGKLPVEGQVDVITLLDVLEHVQDEEDALFSLWDHLKPGGFFICTVPALKILWSRHDVSLHHKRRYNRKEIKELFHKSGFSIHRISYYTTLLFPFVAVQRLIKGFFPKKDPQQYEVSIPPGFINNFFGLMMSFERFLLRFADLPFGSALFVISSKPE